MASRYMANLWLNSDAESVFTATMITASRWRLAYSDP